MANTTPDYMQGNRSGKDNYCPVSILANLSKVFERCMCKQISTFLRISFQCGFRKEHSVQHNLLALTEKRKQSLDNEKTFGAVLSNSSKAFDYLPQSFFTTNLKAYDFDNNSFKSVNDYLSRCFQKTKICNEYNS